MDPDREGEQTHAHADNSYKDLAIATKTDVALFAVDDASGTPSKSRSAASSSTTNYSSSAGGSTKDKDKNSRRGWAQPSPHSGLDISSVSRDSADFWVVRLPPEAAQDGPQDFC